MNEQNSKTNVSFAGESLNETVIWPGAQPEVAPKAVTPVRPATVRTPGPPGRARMPGLGKHMARNFGKTLRRVLSEQHYGPRLCSGWESILPKRKNFWDEKLKTTARF